MVIRVSIAKCSVSSFRQKEKCVFRVFIFASFFQFSFVFPFVDKRTKKGAPQLSSLEKYSEIC